MRRARSRSPISAAVRVMRSTGASARPASQTPAPVANSSTSGAPAAISARERQRLAGIALGADLQHADERTVVHYRLTQDAQTVVGRRQPAQIALAALGD